MTQELLELLTKEHGRVGGGDKSTYHNCLLFDLVSNPAGISQNLRNATKAAMETAHATQGLKRHTLGVLMHDTLKSALEEEATDKGFSAPTSVGVSYWLWPRTRKSDEEVFDANDNTQWKKKMRECIPAFHDDLDITMSVLGQMANPKVSFPDNTPLTAAVAPSELPITVRDVDRFFHMLAWRLWGDQEVGLHRVYTQNVGTWPSPSQYLFCNQYSGVHFGEGVMMYKTPQGSGGHPGGNPSAALARMTKDIEVVIVRPNIEHFMMGIILGQGGESLGSTFWGQVPVGHLSSFPST
jgi:hypothetical protein